MKKINLVLAAAMAVVLLASCGSTKVEQQSTVDKTANEMVITNWSDRNLDVQAKPEWLKKLVCGNADVFRNEYGVKKDMVVKYSVGTARTRDASLAASRVNYNAIRAEELKTKVVSEAAATLNDEGYTEATSNAATLAKVDLTGHQLVTQFWQEVRTTDKETEETKTEYICYSVYQISKQDWLNTLKAFMQQVIPAIPDSKAQVKMANTIQSLYNDTIAEEEKSEKETKMALEAQIELARIDAAKATGVAQANANAEASKAAAAQANANAAASSSSSGGGFDWMDALSLACDILL